MENKKLIKDLSAMVQESCQIDNELFVKFNVKRGLRNADHSGVLVGLTKIGNVIGYIKEEDKITPCEGRLIYRGIDINDLVTGIQQEKRHGFDETVYLLLSGKLPNKKELKQFSEHMISERDLPPSFSKNMILTIRGRDVMNMLARSVLILHAFDDKAEDSSPENQVRQALSVIAKFPAIIAYSYHGMRHSYEHETLSIRHPQADMSTAENFLYMLKGRSKVTKLEADLLDLALVLHAEHGGGNNSSFTMRVTSSSGTDIYSAISSALASLKGPLHGGATLKVMDMMEDIKKNVKKWDNRKEVEEYLIKILNKKAGDKSGKIYGIGHAIYTMSDPRSILLKSKARDLAIEKGRVDEFDLYCLIEELSPEIFSMFKGEGSKIIRANVDFYSGFVYSCLGIKKELFTPLFAMARVAGWCAHRLEELNFASKRIIRPAYKNVFGEQSYIPLEERE